MGAGAAIDFSPQTADAARYTINKNVEHVIAEFGPPKDKMFGEKIKRVKKDIRTYFSDQPKDDAQRMWILLSRGAVGYANQSFQLGKDEKAFIRYAFFSDGTRVTYRPRTKTSPFPAIQIGRHGEEPSGLGPLKVALHKIHFKKK